MLGWVLCCVSFNRAHPNKLKDNKVTEGIMSRVSIIEEKDAKGFVKETYDKFKSQMGIVPNVIKAMSNWPELFEANMKLFQAVMLSETKLKRGTKEMIAAVVSELNRCNYCATHHENFMKQYGISSWTAEEIRRDYHNAGLDEKTLRLLEYAEKVSKNAYKVTDKDFNSLKKLGWTEREIMEATLVVAQFNFINRIVDALGVELETVNV